MQSTYTELITHLGHLRSPEDSVTSHALPASMFLSPTTTIGGVLAEKPHPPKEQQVDTNGPFWVLDSGWLIVKRMVFSATTGPGDRKQARELLHEAQTAFEEMGIPRYAAVAQNRLQEDAVGKSQ